MLRAITVITLTTAGLAPSCSSEFKGSNAGFGAGSNTNKNKDPSKSSGSCDIKVQACVDGKPVNPGTTSLPPGLDTTSGGIVARNVRNIFFSGNGPGSCGGNRQCVGDSPSWLGPQVQQCPVPSVLVPNTGLQGDCFGKDTVVDGTTVTWQWNQLNYVCQGNRSVCAETNSTAAGLTTNIKFSESGCSSQGMLDSGPDGKRYHVLGIVTDRGGSISYQEMYLCKNAIAAKDLKSGDELVTELKFMTPGQHVTSPTECLSDSPANSRWEKIGVISDCVGAAPYCTGFLTVCQKKEKVSF